MVSSVKMTSPDSASDSEEEARLRAAVVIAYALPSFGKQENEKAQVASTIHASSTIPNLLSNQNRKECPKRDLRESRFELEPECKRFLAHKLNEVLEKICKFKKMKKNRTDGAEAASERTGGNASSKGVPRESGSIGIRLFTDSDYIEDLPKKSKNWKGSEPSSKRRKASILKKSSPTEVMLKACSVTADWILHENPLNKLKAIDGNTEKSRNGNTNNKRNECASDEG